MRFSVSLTTSLDPAHQKFFRVVNPQNLHQIINVITKRVWSPLVWQGGRRRSDFFMSCDWLVLDFDDGRWTLEDAKTFCKAKSYAYILGTTKSHQIAKGKNPACDRYRLIIPWNGRIKDIRVYKQNILRIASLIPCDPQCFDAARPYLPCKEIVAFSTGSGMPWYDYVAPRKIEYPKRAQGIVPSWLHAKMLTVPAHGERNKHAFQLAMCLARFGFSEDQVINEVLRAPIDLPESEKRITARSGYKIGITQRQTQ